MQHYLPWYRHQFSFHPTHTISLEWLTLPVGHAIFEAVPMTSFQTTQEDLYFYTFCSYLCGNLMTMNRNWLVGGCASRMMMSYHRSRKHNSLLIMHVIIWSAPSSVCTQNKQCCNTASTLDALPFNVKLQWIHTETDTACFIVNYVTWPMNRV